MAHAHLDPHLLEAVRNGETSVSIPRGCTGKATLRDLALRDDHPQLSATGCECVRAATPSSTLTRSSLEAARDAAGECKHSARLH
jgi:hypothetical protein